MSSIPNSADVAEDHFPGTSAAIDSKLRGCDIVKLRVRDVAHGGKAVPRATVMQQKTGQPLKFKIDRADVRGEGGFDRQGVEIFGEPVKRLGKRN